MGPPMKRPRPGDSDFRMSNDSMTPQRGMRNL